MARRTPDSLFSSLKGKIRLASAAFAFFVCGFGLFAYLLASFFVNSTFYAVFLPFVFLSSAVVLFGWWLSKEIAAPVERVGLLAKSLERGAAVSLPKTTGSVETDEILQSLQRNSQQLQNVVGLMDKVAGGQLDIALTPLQNSDRLSSSFQTLLAKVSESIDAKQKLENMESAIGNVTAQIARIRRNNLDVELTADFPETREISETIKYLVRHLNEMVSQIRRDSHEARTVTAEVQQTIHAAISEDESKARQISQAALMFKQMPNNVRKISEELSGSISAANYSIEKARKGSAAAQENLQAVAALRKQLQEAIKRVGRLNERSKEITKTAKTVEDLAHRTNLVALNASIQAVGLSEKGYGFTVLAEEVERLSARAENTKREISSLNKSIAAEIVEVENTLLGTVGEAANLSKFAIETGDSLSELEKYVSKFLNLQIKLSAYSDEQMNESERSLGIFNETFSNPQRAADHLRKTENGIGKLFNLMEHLENSAADFKLSTNNPRSEAEPEIVSDINLYSEPVEEYEPEAVV